MARNTNKIAVLNVLRGTSKDHPLPNTDIATLANEHGATFTPKSISGTMTQWYQKATDGFQWVHRIDGINPKTQKPHLCYYWDTNVERKPSGPWNPRKPQNAPIQKNPRPATLDNIQKKTESVGFGRIFEVPEHGFCLIVNDQGQIIKGRYLTE